MNRSARLISWLFPTVVLFAIAVGGCTAGAPEEVQSVTPRASVTSSATETTVPETAELLEPTEPTVTQPADSPQATATPRPTNTARPSVTPSATPRPTRTPSPTPDLFSPYAPPDPAEPTPEIPYPTAVPLLQKPGNVINIMLLGNDGDGTLAHRTDAMMLLSVNLSTETATLLSLPRDLYVYQPGWRIDRINLAMPHGGAELLNETLRYNLGLEFDYFVRIGFDGFRQAVDALGGISVPVICPLEDWRLASPELDPAVEENWVRYRLEPDVVAMDGDLALWYARSRRSTSDFDRGRRQQQLLNAMLDQATRLDALADVPGLWSAFQGAVMTDLPVTRMVQLAALAPALRDNGVRHLAIAGDSVNDLRVGEGRMWVQLLNWEEAQRVVDAVYREPALGRASRSPLTVNVLADNWIDYRLAAENLMWHGFIPSYTQIPEPEPATTTITYHGPNLKGSYDWLVSWIFHNVPVTLAPDGAAVTDYTVVLGADFNPCRLPVYTP